MSQKIYAPEFLFFIFCLKILQRCFASNICCKSFKISCKC